MIEKRFILDFDDPRAVWIDDNITNKSYTVINDTLKKRNIQEIVDCLNEQHETIHRLEAQLSHIEYRFTEYRNKVGKND